MLGSYSLLLFLLHPAFSQLVNYCLQPLQQPPAYFKTVKASRTLESLPNPKFNLLYQMQQHPCMEVQYFSASLHTSNHYRIHGTCNFQRMFRFTARRTPYSCWRMTLDIWDRRLGTFERRRLLNEIYELKFATPGVPIAVERVGNKTRRYAMFDFIRPVMFAENVVRRMFGAYEKDTIGAEIPECQCGNRSQIEVWTKRSSGTLHPGVHSIVRAVVVVAGLLGLGYGAYRVWLTRDGHNGLMRADSF